MNRCSEAAAQTLVRPWVGGAPMVMPCYQPSVHSPLATPQMDVVPPTVLMLAGAWEAWPSGPAMNVDGEGEINVKDPDSTFTHFFSCLQVKVQVSFSLYRRHPHPMVWQKRAPLCSQLQHRAFYIRLMLKASSTEHNKGFKNISFLNSLLLN